MKLEWNTACFNDFRSSSLGCMLFLLIVYRFQIFIAIIVHDLTKATYVVRTQFLMKELLSCYSCSISICRIDSCIQIQRNWSITHTGCSKTAFVDVYVCHQKIHIDIKQLRQIESVMLHIYFECILNSCCNPHFEAAW